MGDEFIRNATAVVIFAIVVVCFHVIALSVNIRKFNSESDPLLVIGYLFPLIWFGILMRLFLDTHITDTLYMLFFGIVSAVYFGAWYYLRNATHSDRHYPLYIGGLVGLILMLVHTQSYLNEFTGLAIGVCALFFAILYIMKPFVQREMSFFVLAVLGIIFTIVEYQSLIGYDDIFLGKNLFIVLSLIPFLFAFLMQPRKDEPDKLVFWTLRSSAVLAAIIIFLIFFQELLEWEELPKDFLFFTIPSALVLAFGLAKKEPERQRVYITFSVFFAVCGMFLSFFEILENMYANTNVGADKNLLFQTTESLIGVSTLIILGICYYKVQQLTLEKSIQEEIKSRFVVTFLFYLVLWAVVSHELLGILHMLVVDFENPYFQGIRAATLTLWWVVLALFMIFKDIKTSTFLNEKNIGFGLLCAALFKLVVYDLANVNTNIKIFLFILIGAGILGVSYFFQIKKPDTQEIEE